MSEKKLIFSEGVCEGVDSKSAAASPGGIAAERDLGGETFGGVIYTVGYIIWD